MIFGIRLHTRCCGAYISFLKISACKVGTFHRGVNEIMLMLVQWYCIIFWCKEHLANICWLYHREHSLWLCYIMPVTKPCFIFLIQPSAKWGEAPTWNPGCHSMWGVWSCLTSQKRWWWIINAGVVMIALRKSCSITASTTKNNCLCHRNWFCSVLLICVITSNLHVHPVCHIKVLYK
jgi:hypothetical protein